MLKATYSDLTLHFKRPSGTSRGILTEKLGYLITVWDDESPEIKGYGECSLIPGLSPDECEGYLHKLTEVCASIETLKDSFHQSLVCFPSIRFGVETALADLQGGGCKIFFDTPFSRGDEGITINGLIWMGSKEYMLEQIDTKLAAGFSCLKMKIGAINIADELDVLKFIRTRFDRSVLELRVDANGAFPPSESADVLKQLAELDIHSIEQPIKAGQWHDMASLCVSAPLPVALDEELIGVSGEEKQRELLETIRPQYIILKPSLLGGLKAAEQWINLADKLNIGWWVTSALESNIGLNAIAQWCSTLNTTMPQGLGTGSLYTNNVPSGLVVKGEKLWLTKS